MRSAGAAVGVVVVMRRRSIFRVVRGLPWRGLPWRMMIPRHTRAGSAFGRGGLARSLRLCGLLRYCLRHGHAWSVSGRVRLARPRLRCPAHDLGACGTRRRWMMAVRSIGRRWCLQKWRQVGYVSVCA